MIYLRSNVARAPPRPLNGITLFRSGMTPMIGDDVHQRLMLRLLSGSLLAAMLVFCAGCIVTSTTWKRATTPRLQPEFQYSAVSGCLVDRSVTPPRARALIVMYVADSADRSYAIGSGEKNHVVIDLDADGEPVWPYAYRGDKKDAGEVWKDLPEEQRQALSSVRFGHSEFEQGAEAVRSRDFIPANCEGIGIHAATVFDQHPLTFYWPASETPAGAIQWNNGKPYVNGAWPADAKRLVLPTDQPRPFFGIVSDMCFAALMLPIEVGMDMIVTPLSAGWAWGWWGS